MAWAITDAKLLNASTNGELQIIENATIIMEDGKICAVGVGTTPPDNCNQVNARGSYVLPGLVDPCTRLGVREEGHGPVGRDDEEDEKDLNPTLKALDAAWPEDTGFADARKSGVTTVGVLPGTKTVVSGQASIFKTFGNTVNEMCIDDSWALRINISKASSLTPAGAVRQIRRALVQTRHKMKHSKDACCDSDDELSPGDRIWPRVLSKDITLLCRADDFRDILNICELQEEFDLDVVIERLTEGYYATDELSCSPCSVVIGPLLLNRRGHTRSTSLRTPKIVVEEAQVPVALTTDHPTMHIDHILVAAAVAHSRGLSEGHALAAVTSVPAKILGLQDRVGSVEVGKDADVAMYSGHPFETESVVTHLFIDGHPVELEEGSNN